MGAGVLSNGEWTVSNSQVAAQILDNTHICHLLYMDDLLCGDQRKKKEFELNKKIKKDLKNVISPFC